MQREVTCFVGCALTPRLGRCPSTADCSTRCRNLCRWRSIASRGTGLVRMSVGLCSPPTLRNSHSPHSRTKAWIQCSAALPRALHRPTHAALMITHLMRACVHRAGTGRLDPHALVVLRLLSSVPPLVRVRRDHNNLGLQPELLCERVSAAVADLVHDAARRPTGAPALYSQRISMVRLCRGHLDLTSWPCAP